MVKDCFVKGKNQNGFNFLMENTGKAQLSMFACATVEAQPVEAQPVEVKPVEVKPVEVVKGFSPQEIAILDAMRKGADHIDVIIQQSGLNAGIVAGTLLMMEMSGNVKQKPGRFFALTTCFKEGFFMDAREPKGKPRGCMGGRKQGSKDKAPRKSKGLGAVLALRLPGDLLRRLEHEARVQGYETPDYARKILDEALL